MGYLGADPADRTILVVEDDAAQRGEIVTYVAGHDYVVRGAADAGEMDEVLAQMPVDLVVVDATLPGEDGWSVCRRLAQGAGPAVIVLCARDSDADRIRALEAGADDVLTKPFNPRELVARAKAVLRGRQGHLARPRRFLGADFQLGQNHLRTSDGEVVVLTPGELSVLSALVEYPGRVLSRDEILERAYGETEVFDRAVDVHISRLRRKLAACSAEPAIRTHRHAGYQFIARVD